MVGSCDVKFPIRLESLVLTHSQFSRCPVLSCVQCEHVGHCPGYQLTVDIEPWQRVIMGQTVSYIHVPSPTARPVTSSVVLALSGWLPCRVLLVASTFLHNSSTLLFVDLQVDCCGKQPMNASGSAVSVLIGGGVCAVWCDKWLISPVFVISNDVRRLLYVRWCCGENAEIWPNSGQSTIVHFSTIVCLAFRGGKYNSMYG